MLIVYLTKEYYMGINIAISRIAGMEAQRIERTKETLSYINDSIRNIASRATRNLQKLQEIVNQREREGNPPPLSVLSLMSSQSTILDPLSRLRSKFENRLNSRSFSIAQGSNLLDNLKKPTKKKKKKSPEEIMYDIIRARISQNIISLPSSMVKETS